jgi:Zn-dependent protease
MPLHEDDSRTYRPGGLPLGRLFGVPVRLNPSWLVLAVLVTFVYGLQVGASRPELRGPAVYGLGAGFVAGLLISVLLHELGHALASRRLGTGVRGITLELLGGYTDMERDAPRPGIEAAVSLAGVAVWLAVTGRVTFVGAAFGVVMAGSVAVGGAAAVRAGRAGARLRLVAIDALTRPIFAVPAGTTIADAARLAADTGPADAVLGVVDPDGRLRAVVPESGEASVPADRRAEVERDAVARLVGAYRSSPAGLTGDEVLHAVESDPVGDYLVTSGEDVVGILRVADVARVLDPNVGPRVVPARRSTT